MENTYSINLGSYLQNVGEILSGRDIGYSIRKKLQLELKEDSYDKIEITFPDYVVGINPSFFLGLLGESIRKYHSKEKFLNKYKLIYNQENNIYLQEDINDSIERALKEGGLLSDF